MKPKLFKTIQIIITFCFATSQATQYIEVAGGSVNGRSSDAYCRSTGKYCTQIDKNVTAILEPGTQGKIIETSRQESGNGGIYVEITSEGPNKGKKVWVYYNIKNPFVNLYEEPETVPNRKPINNITSAFFTEHIVKDEVPVIDDTPTSYLKEAIGQKEPDKTEELISKSFDKNVISEMCSMINPNYSKAIKNSVSCIKWATDKAIESLNEPKCKKLITSRFLMCIFKQENSDFATNADNGLGAGLSQMTWGRKGGINTVYRGFKNYNLDDYFTNLFESLDRNINLKNEKIDRSDAFDRDYAIGLAATHLCTQVLEGNGDTPYELAVNYNGNNNENEKGERRKYPYARDVDACNNGYGKYHDIVTRLNASCRKYDNCEDDDLSNSKLSSTSFVPTESFNFSSLKAPGNK